MWELILMIGMFGLTIVASAIENNVTANDRDFHRIRRYMPFDYVKPWPGANKITREVAPWKARN